MDDGWMDDDRWMSNEWMDRWMNGWVMEVSASEKLVLLAILSFQSSCSLAVDVN